MNVSFDGGGKNERSQRKQEPQSAAPNIQVKSADSEAQLCCLLNIMFHRAVFPLG